MAADWTASGSRCGKVRHMSHHPRGESVGSVSRYTCVLSLNQLPVLSSSEGRRRGEAEQKRSTTMLPVQVEEGKTLLSSKLYLLTITAAAVAETGEGSRGVSESR